MSGDVTVGPTSNMLFKDIPVCDFAEASKTALTLVVHPNSVSNATGEPGTPNRQLRVLKAWGNRWTILINAHHMLKCT